MFWILASALLHLAINLCPSPWLTAGVIPILYSTVTWTATNRSCSDYNVEEIMRVSSDQLPIHVFHKVVSSLPWRHPWLNYSTRAVKLAILLSFYGFIRGSDLVWSAATATNSSFYFSFCRIMSANSTMLLHFFKSPNIGISIILKNLYWMGSNHLSSYKYNNHFKNLVAVIITNGKQSNN